MRLARRASRVDSRRVTARLRCLFLMASLACAVQLRAATHYQTVLECSGLQVDPATGQQSTAKMVILPASSTDQALWLGAAEHAESVPLALGAGMGVVIWDDGVFGVRRDRALQLTQPTRDRPAYGAVEMPLVIIGFRRSPSGSIPLIVQVEVHQPGIPFRAWLPGRDALFTGNCEGA